MFFTWLSLIQKNSKRSYEMRKKGWAFQKVIILIIVEREVADDNFVYCTFLGVSITYDRNGDITGRLLVLLILFALFMTLMSRVRGIKSPISMDTFVSKTNSMVYYVNIESL